MPQPSAARAASAFGGTTPQRAGEPAWHRRARRQRGAARTLLRVAAAAGVLDRHHSAARQMGGSRGGSNKGGYEGKGKGDGAGQWSGGVADMLRELRKQSAQQQQLLRALQDGGNLAATAAQGGKGQREWRRGEGDASRVDERRWDRGEVRGNKSNARGRPGDWACGECGAFPCFARTVRCYQCSAPRRGGSAAGEEARGKGRGRVTNAVDNTTYLGPMGANGSRPLLGRRAETVAKAAGDPSYRVPGASVAARVESARRQKEDEEGFQTVPSGRAARTAVVATACPGDPAARGKAPTGTRNSWALLSEEDEDEEDVVATDERDGMDKTRGDCDEDGGGRTGSGGREGDNGKGEERDEPSEAELKSRWMALCALVRRIEREPHPLPPGVLDSIKAQRDEAERQWRSEKKPHPISKRLRWAEADLRAAQKKEEDRKKELQDHLEWAAMRTEEIKNRLGIDEARTARKRDALRALQRECGLPERPNMEKAARVAVEGIASDIAPALSSIIEQLGESDEGLRCDLQLLSTSLGRVEGVLREAAELELSKDSYQRQLEQRRQGGAQPARFDIGDDAMEMVEEDGDSGADGGDDNGTRKSRRVENGHKGAHNNTTRWTKPSTNAPWKKETSSAEAADEARRLLQGAGGPTPLGREAETSPAYTNDLAVAERRSKEEAVRQQQEALQQQQRVREDHELAQAAEQGRQQREAQRQDEMRKHQEAMERAAQTAAADEARRKEELWANMSQDQRAQATRLIEQQAAVGAHAFGTLAASQLAGLVHQAHVHEVVQASAEEQAGEVDRLMAMSPEEFMQWDRERQSLQ